jgi:hypothetical protein
MRGAPCRAREFAETLVNSIFLLLKYRTMRESLSRDLSRVRWRIDVEVHRAFESAK